MIGLARMRHRTVRHVRYLLRSWMFLMLIPSCVFAGDPALPSVDQILDHTGGYVVRFLEKFSNVKCTELVTQAKLGKGGRTEYAENSTFDYLVLNQSSHGELNLIESRLAESQSEHKRNLPLLVTNGFSTLLLVFHPSYQASFEYTPTEVEARNGKPYVGVRFRHVKGTRSTTALLLRGREYPLDLEGVAWVDPTSGAIEEISARLGTSMEDIGLRSLRCDVQYAPHLFPGLEDPYWLPTSARVDVETPRQHWRNTHRFTAYQRFSTSVESRIGGSP